LAEDERKKTLYFGRVVVSEIKRIIGIALRLEEAVVVVVGKG